MRRILGVALASIGMSAFSRELHQASDGMSALSSVLRQNQPNKCKSKQNRVSQAKRRKYARQGR